jgi:hypothetical protein
VAKAVLKKAVKKLQIKMEVIVHNSEVKNGLDLKFDEHKAIALQNIQKRNPEQGDEEIKDPQFCDYAGIPMIMIVIECGRMGDTFPECVRFDLRARYLSPVQDFTSIIQVTKIFFHIFFLIFFCQKITGSPSLSKLVVYNLNEAEITFLLSRSMPLNVISKA